MSSYHRLFTFVEEYLKTSHKGLKLDLNENTSLVKSGLLDSLGLIELASWIEGEFGCRLELTSAELLKECDTVADIVKVFDKEQRGGISASEKGPWTKNIIVQSDEYEIVRYRPEFRKEIPELQKHLWSPDFTLNSRYLEWKYECNPYVTTPLIYVVLFGERVVGMRGFYGAKWEIDKRCESLIGLCAGDLVIAPEHRNRGLFRRIMTLALDDLAESGYVYIFNLSASLVTYTLSLTTGWRSVGSVEPMMWQGMQRSVGGGRHLFYFLDRNGRGSRARASKYVSLDQNPRPHAMAKLIERIGTDGRIRHVRDHKYFIWRFRNPLSSYRFLFWEDSRLEGYLVLQTSVYPKRGRVNIVDWEATDPQVRADLLRSAIDWGKFDNLLIWSATLPEDAKTLLRDTGFTSVEATGDMLRAHRPAILVKCLPYDTSSTAEWVPDKRSLLDPRNWDIRMLYSDAF